MEGVLGSCQQEASSESRSPVVAGGFDNNVKSGLLQEEMDWHADGEQMIFIQSSPRGFEMQAQSHS